MRILQLGKFYPIRGGVEKVMWDLTRGLSERGVYCDMLCAAFEPGVIEFNGYGRCICVKSLAKLAATMISPAMVLWLKKHCNEYNIIHVHHPDPMACLALWMSGYRGRVILHWHSDILKQKGLLTFYRPLQNWLIRRAERIVGTTPVYVAQSPDLAGVREKLTCLPIGIEDNIRSCSTAGKTDGTVMVFSLGRLVEYKGYRFLVDAAAFLPDNYRIVIAGQGPLKDELQARIDAVAPGRVELLGYVSDERARELYNACDVFVLSSIMKTEAFGIVQLEAMSCGKPVVATHIPGSGTDWVNEDGVSGLNVPPRDAEALAAAIMELCGERHDAFCRGARERYEKMFTFGTMIDAALKIYENKH